VQQQRGQHVGGVSKAPRNQSRTMPRHLPVHERHCPARLSQPICVSNRPDTPPGHNPELFATHWKGRNCFSRRIAE
jgi:hypothetical protein